MGKAVVVRSPTNFSVDENIALVLKLATRAPGAVFAIPAIVVMLAQGLTLLVERTKRDTTKKTRQKNWQQFAFQTMHMLQALTLAVQHLHLDHQVQTT